MALYVASHYKVSCWIFTPELAALLFLLLFADFLFSSRVPEFAKRPAVALRRSGPSPLLPPATGAALTELAT